MRRLTTLLLAVGVGVARSGMSASASAPLAVDVELTPRGVAVLAATAPATAFDPQGPAGWRMVDRFRAFRFEFTLPSEGASASSMAETVASRAREHKCFGWIQETGARRVAGEVRCPTRASAVLEALLRGYGDDRALVLARYANSKIRYHFPRFRVLSEPTYHGRTCFATPPHACGSPQEDTSTTDETDTDKRERKGEHRTV